VSNWIDYRLDVLASSPEEINRIAARLKLPSSKLVDWVADRFHEPPSEAATGLAELLSFEPVEHLFYLHESFFKARRFHNTFRWWIGIVNSHLFEVSEEYPKAVFLLEHFEMQVSYSGKVVIRAGEIIQEVFDGDHLAQALDWVLLDIFAPFRAEWEGGLEFRSLWREWVEDVATAVETLRNIPKQCREIDENSPAGIRHTI
jgi:hypothetical protein